MNKKVVTALVRVIMEVNNAIIANTVIIATHRAHVSCFICI